MQRIVWDLGRKSLTSLRSAQDDTQGIDMNNIQTAYVRASS